jgi:glycosyltransferase involved in cell wall biosynthesis
VVTYADGQASVLEAAIERARAVVVPAIAVAGIPALARAGVPIAVDGHNPFQAETFYLREAGASGQDEVLTAAYLLGDFFFCASERQRDWWLGLLEANGRVNSLNYGADPSLRRLVDLVPYGLPASAPQHAQPVLKGVVPGIGPDDKVLLWGGGLWPWLDPLTAIRAVSQLRPQRPDLRLVLPATRHPNPNIASLPNLLTAARALADELGLLNSAVFFVEWAPYARWPSYLLESDVGLTLHRRDTLEARLAYRTRVLDYLWAGLPAVATQGDVLADLLMEHRLGAVVEPEDPPSVAEGILQALAVDRNEAAERFKTVRRAFQWETVARPLIEFCRHPQLAPDKLALGQQLGNTYYTKRIAALEARVRWYDRHRLVKLARRLDPIVLRLPWLRRWVRP